MPRWLIVGIGSTCVFAATVCGLNFFGPQTLMALEARGIGRDIPSAYRVPVELPDRSVSAVAGAKLSYFGYEFEAPWNDLDPAKDRAGGPIHITCFQSGNALWFSTFPARDFVDGVMEIDKGDPKTFRRLFGDAALQSDYAFKLLMLETTPSQITPLSNRTDAARRSTLLLIKAISMPQADSGLYLISTADRKGFQYGDPRSQPKKIVDELYADDGGMDFIFFKSSDAKAPSITQAEINRVIQSLHKLPDPGLRAQR